MKTAYSYIRFSTPQQSGGDSLRRQLEASRRYAVEKSFILDESLKPDRGISAFHGRNRTEGNLGAFLAAVQAGRVPKGSALLVESLDRLSREEIETALTAFLNIINLGIEIHTLSDRQIYRKGHLRLEHLLISITVMSRSVEESTRKSERCGEAWMKKRHNANGNSAMSERVPAWLVAEKGQPIRVRPDRAKIVRQIYRWAAQGLGQYQITDKLIADGVEPFGPVRQGRQPRWTPAYVGEILRNERLLGHYQPMTKVRVETDPETGEKRRVPLKKRVPDGLLVENYYPQVISYDLWQKVQETRRAFAQAKFGDSLHAGKNKFSDKNLFRKLVWDANNNTPMVYSYYDGHPCLVTTYRPQLRRHKVSYPIFEKRFIRFLSEADWAAIANENAASSNDQPQQLEDVAKAIIDNERVLARYEAILDDPESRDSDRVSAKYRSALKEAKRLVEERTRLEAEIRSRESDALLSGRDTKFNVRSPENRLKLRLWIAQAVSRIDLYFAEPRSMDLEKIIDTIAELRKTTLPKETKFTVTQAALTATLREGQISIRVVFTNGVSRQILLEP